MEVEAIAIKKTMRRKKYLFIVYILIKTVETTNITKYIPNLDINFPISELLATALVF